MLFRPTRVSGAFVVVPERHEDERGFFARTWDREAFASRGLRADLDQCSASFNASRGTLRGMHFQKAPHEEAKLVRCTAGAVFDVALDLRPASRTYMRWEGVELTAENRLALYVPPGCAHGFLTLTDGAEVFYQIAGRYAPEAASGVRYDDPAFGIEWPEAVRVINARDAQYGDWEGGS
jgi:dTDP-4-dehydrorhamnose 3,5-epimerase